MHKTLLYIVCASVLAVPASLHAQEDLRSYQHGIDIITLPSGDHALIWSSGGNPPSGEWTHDVYVSPLTAQSSIVPRTLISRYEAQEPASSAINNDGHILITMEDGWNVDSEVGQRYGVYDSAFNPVRPYPELLLDGGHSGHAAAVGSRFVVFYSEGWVDGGGVDNLGSGDEVHAAIVATDGTVERTVDVAVGPTRDWWPLVAGSPTRALLVWQRFVHGETHAQLMAAVLDPATGSVSTPQVLASSVQYYTYGVVYVPAVRRFVVTMTNSDRTGTAVLLDESGVERARTTIDAVVRESQPFVRDDGATATVVQARAPSGLVVMSASVDALSPETSRDDPYQWQYMGVDGVFMGDTAHLLALSTTGIKRVTFDVSTDREKAAPLRTPVVPIADDVSDEHSPVSETTSTEAVASTDSATAREEVVDVSKCDAVRHPSLMSFAERFVLPWRSLLPSAHLLAARHCAA